MENIFRVPKSVIENPFRIIGLAGFIENIFRKNLRQFPRVSGRSGNTWLGFGCASTVRAASISSHYPHLDGFPICRSHVLCFIKASMVRASISFHCHHLDGFQWRHALCLIQAFLIIIRSPLDQLGDVLMLVKD